MKKTSISVHDDTRSRFNMLRAEAAIAIGQHIPDHNTFVDLLCTHADAWLASFAKDYKKNRRV